MTLERYAYEQGWLETKIGRMAYAFSLKKVKENGLSAPKKIRRSLRKHYPLALQEIKEYLEYLRTHDEEMYKALMEEGNEKVQ